MSASDLSWRITAHICRACMGRVLAREAIGGLQVYRCSNCGTEREGRGEVSLCCCGIRLGRSMRDAGIRCIPNPSPTPECQSEIVAREVVLEGKAGGPARREPKASNDDELWSEI